VTGGAREASLEGKRHENIARIDERKLVHPFVIVNYVLESKRK